MPSTNDLNAGSAVESDLDASDSGSSEMDDSSDSSNPEGMPSAPAVDYKAKHEKLLADNKALNRLVVDLKRQANSNKGYYKSNQAQANGAGQDGGEGQYDFDTAFSLAEADVRNRIEDIIELYPELPSNEVSRIRKNPMSFISRNTLRSLNVDDAVLDIETYMAQLVGNMDVESSTATKVTPNKQVRPGQPSENQGSVDAEPGSDEDDNLYTMPITKLEKLAKKEIRKKTGK